MAGQPSSQLHLNRSPLADEPSRRRALSRAASLALLVPGGHGRVAASMKAVPVIIPVQFSLVGEDVFFSLGPGSDLSRAVADAVVAFETDHLGPDGEALWDVHVLGVAETTAGDGRSPVFRLSTEIVTGWRNVS